MHLKADAFREYNEAAVLDKLLTGFPDIVRLMLEGKLDDKASALEALSTCLTCGACTTACYAKVPVVDIVLEGRRMLRGETHWLVRAVCRIMVKSPQFFAVLLNNFRNPVSY